MTELFNMVELVGFGIEKEKMRRDFYDMVSKSFEDTKIKKLFAQLRDWETEHIRRFTEIQNSIEEDKPFESFSGELNEYAQALIDDVIYSKMSPASFKSEVKAPIDAIRRGMQFEKDAILFFVTLEPHVGSKHKSVVNTLIGEEKKHLLYLNDLKSRYAS